MKIQPIILFTVLAASCSVATPAPINVHESEFLVASSEVGIVNAKVTSVHYSAAMPQEVKNDLNRRLQVFPQALGQRSRVGLREGVEMSGSDYLGYSLVDLEGAAQSREVWIMILSDDEPELHFRNAEDEETWGSPEYSRLNSTKDGHVFVFKMSKDAAVEAVKEPLHLIVSTQDGRNMRIDA